MKDLYGLVQNVKKNSEMLKKILILIVYQMIINVEIQITKVLIIIIKLIKQKMKILKKKIMRIL